MNRDMVSKFNPEILMELESRLMSTLVGKEVMLTNGRFGTIIMIDPYNPLKALLKNRYRDHRFTNGKRKENRTNHRLMEKSPIIKNRALRHSALPNQNRF
ncbi:PRC-barrel domain-containing protein [Peribacillus frigoritolerans]|uniref:PRC-barrel domain-containing protein n=1 Tax=Peribacillus frigoritolerans TaxID=450367 RepID=UPI003D074C98